MDKPRKQKNASRRVEGNQSASPAKPEAAQSQWVGEHMHGWLLTLSLCAVAANAVAAEDLVRGISMFVLVTAAWAFSGGRRPSGFPRVAVNVALIGVLIYGVIEVMTTQFGVVLFSNVMGVLLVIKMLDRRGVRDASQVLMLASFIGIASVLTSNSLSTAIFLLFVVVSGVIAACLIQMESAQNNAPSSVASRSSFHRGTRTGGRRKRGAASAHTSSSHISSTRTSPVYTSPGHAPPAQTQRTQLPTQMRRRATRQLKVLTTIGVAVAIVIASGIFVLMPRRLAVGSFGDWGTAALGRVVGFNPTIRLGEGGLIEESEEPVIDLQIKNAAGHVVGISSQPFYLRGAVLDQYDPKSGEWNPRHDRLRIHDFETGRKIVIGQNDREWDIEQHITIRNIGRPRSKIFTIWKPQSLDIRSGIPISWDQDTHELGLIRHTGRLDYIVRSRLHEPRLQGFDGGRGTSEDGTNEHDASERAKSGAGELSSETRDEKAAGFLERPAPRQPVTGPVMELAIQILRDADLDPDPNTRPWADDLEAAEALSDYLEGPEFRYTLETVAAPVDADPVAWFLLENKEGHCEYYASAHALMCRAVGIESRVITGYAASEYNEATEHYVVRASNAHAWVEVLIGPQQWETFDPTPSGSDGPVHAPATGPLASIRRWFEVIEFTWIREVIGYDAGSRKSLLDMGQHLAVLDRFIQKQTGTRQSRASLRRGLLVVGLGCGLLSVAIWMLARDPTVRAMLRRWRRALRARLVFGDRVRVEAELLAMQLDHLFERLHLPRDPSVPIATHVQHNAVGLGNALTEGIIHGHKTNSNVHGRNAFGLIAAAAEALNESRFGKRRISVQELRSHANATEMLLHPGTMATDSN